MIIAIACWYLWWERRKLVHGEIVQQPAQIVLSILALAENFTAAAASSAKVKRNPWSRPPSGYIKLNVDALYDADSLQGTVGAVLCDSSGKFLAASNNRAGDCLDVFMAEALALRFGLNLASFVGCTRLIINSDSMDVIAAMQDGGISSGSSAGILDDCFHMARDFTHIRFEHCHREANSVADELARLCKSLMHLNQLSKEE